jgi:hypothetical protein
VNGDRYFNVYLQYKCQLKAYKKKLFDPFCRKQRIGFHYDEYNCVVTTIGQLNFFKWALSYKVLEYVQNNLDNITKDMILSNKIIVNNYKLQNNQNISSEETQVKDNNINKDKVKKSDKIDKHIESDRKQSTSDSDKIRKKRHELSERANKTINMHNYSIDLSFD